ncbi:MAG: hypothetical protein KKA42_14280 [candidate division Zixibacteria bacterium]|nr:hypothetical protein [candidate division Zixibacteria bacterium]
MIESPYRTAGWIAIVQAILFPISMVVGIVQGIAARAMLGRGGVMVGPADLGMLIFTLLSVYVLWTFRRLLNERYACHDLDTLLTVCIVWNVVTQLLTLAGGTIFMLSGRVPQPLMLMWAMGIFALFMISGGVINILVAVQLFRLKDQLNETIHVYGWICMIAGVCQLTLILSPVAAILMPVACVVMALIFFREKDELEFV